MLLVCLFGMFAHWLSCLWYYVGFVGRTEVLVDLDGLGKTTTIVAYNWLIKLGDDLNKTYYLADTAKNILMTQSACNKFTRCDEHIRP